LVAYNAGWFRRVAGLTQKQFGEKVGLSEASVSAAERSWSSSRVREFDADEIVLFATVLGVPVVALLLPPADSGTGVDYTFIAGTEELEPDDLVPVIITDYQGDSKAMVAFRDRIAQVGGGRFMEPIQQEADRIVMRARDFAQGLIDDTRGAAEDIERRVQERYQRAMEGLIPQYEALERRVTDLRAFEREYRKRLIDYHADALRGLLSVDAEGADLPPLPKVPPEATPPRGDDER
jgi:transcriptional regulator with XRE-family HTH domain